GDNFVRTETCAGGERHGCEMWAGLYAVAAFKILRACPACRMEKTATSTGSSAQNGRKNGWHSAGNREWPERTMLRWKRSQRAVLVAMLPELANLGVAGLVFGQAISD